jgi:cyclopropane fatty-acyl-phospholipid synthase-like methyltransferase
MDPDSLGDVPSPIDLRKMDDARHWAETAMVKRPYREEFFQTIAQELGLLYPHGLAVLELGSGPGFLALRILEKLHTAAYVALDFSSSMHALAKERLGALASRVQFVESDFKGSDWNAGLPTFDAVVSIQTVHELRHKRHAPSLYRSVRSLLRTKGAFLMCDHFIGEGVTDARLNMTLEEHEHALRAGGFLSVAEVKRKGSLVLFRAKCDVVPE